MPSDVRRVRAITPLLLVQDVHVSATFYCEVLGFEDPAFFGEPETFCMLNRDGHDLMLQQAAAPSEVHANGRAGCWDMYVKVADVAAEQRAIERAGGRILAGPRDTFYRMREIEVDDPDGHRTCLGQELD